MSVVAVDHPNVTIEAVKKADREDGVVVRVCEVWGRRGRVRLTPTLPPTSAVRADVLERDVSPVTIEDGSVVLDLRPFELVTLKLTSAR